MNSYIKISLERNHVPHVIRKYFHNLYNHSTAAVETKNLSSNEFKFKRGVFQGDPIGPVLFLLVFNPILQKLQETHTKVTRLGKFLLWLRHMLIISVFFTLIQKSIRIWLTIFTVKSLQWEWDLNLQSELFSHSQVASQRQFHSTLVTIK